MNLENTFTVTRTDFISIKKSCTILNTLIGHTLITCLNATITKITLNLESYQKKNLQSLNKFDIVQYFTVPKTNTLNVSKTYLSLLNKYIYVYIIYVFPVQPNILHHVNHTNHY